VALFNRNQQDDTEEVPSEIQEYYEAEKRERTWVAWVLALATLAATVLLALGLYFGGRWVYRQAFDNDKTETQTEQSQEEQNETVNSPVAVEPENESAPQPTTPSPSPQTQPQSQPSRPETSTTSSSANSANPSTSSTTTPRTGPLPSTGPADVLTLFIVTTLVATVLHRLFTTRTTDSN
jgi:hypothetical protein